jgi:hypothetical protein
MLISRWVLSSYWTLKTPKALTESVPLPNPWKIFTVTVQAIRDRTSCYMTMASSAIVVWSCQIREDFQESLVEVDVEDCSHHDLQLAHRDCQSHIV